MTARTTVIIGTSHVYQYPTEAGSSEFRKLVEAVIARFRIQAIGEEMSLDGLSMKRVERSVCAKVAADLGLVHRYCDPTKEERARLGVQTPHEIKIRGFFADTPQEEQDREVRASFAIRERYWMDQLVELDCWPALFVCGADHVGAFVALLHANGLLVRVAAADWAPTQTERAAIDQLG